jgi:putative ABC transport system ATP-binding protein
VECALLARGFPSAERRRRTLEALAAVGIAEQAGQRPNRMSGGQQQRVAIARALARDVDVVLADEPTASLDQATGRAVMELLRRLNRDRGITFIFSTHDPRILAAADRIVQLTDGRIAP